MATRKRKTSEKQLQHVENYRNASKDAGLIRTEVIIPANLRSELLAWAKEMREDHKRKLSISRHFDEFG